MDRNDLIENHSSAIADAMQNHFGVPVSVSKSKTPYGISHYVKPQFDLPQSEVPFTVRVSDHAAWVPRHHQIEHHVYPKENDHPKKFIDESIGAAKEYGKRVGLFPKDEFVPLTGDVYHPTFGTGKIIDSKPDVAKVDFGSKGVKNISSRFLQPVDPHNPDITKSDGGPITAYHGSPHDFEQFDTSKIGTGEGAQAYGHGLYFAEHEPVAEGYREKLSHTNNAIGYVDPHLNAKNLIEKLKGNEDYAADILKNRLSELEPDTYEHQQINDTLNHILSGSYKKDLPRKGHMYEVAIDAHPDHFLDWDKGLNNQSEHVRNALKSLGFSYDPSSGPKAYRGAGNTWYVADKFGNKIHSGLNYEEAHKIADRGITGADIHENLTNKVGAIDWPVDSDANTRAQYRKSAAEQVSKHLSDHGIHGIRYLDAGSRGSNEQPTHNYVVFDHNRVKIKRKYEQGGRVAYKKGGKVEGAIWHEKDVYGDGGTTHEPHKRAEEQGYSIKGYHFTRGPKAQSIAKSKQFDPYLSEGGENATFFWDNPQAANDWAHFAGGVDPNKPQEKMTPNELDRLSRFAPNMLPVRIHPGKHTVVNWPEATGLHSYDNVKMKKLIQNARNEGYDTVRIKNMREGDVEHELEKYPETPYDQIAVLNPNVIRSEFAQFDPARQHENDIGARKGGTVDREKVDYKKMPHSPIVEHVLSKISAPLPALDPHLLAAIAGRRS
jgi:ADP-Ribosyltransferase in polyvalent proteins